MIGRNQRTAGSPGKRLPVRIAMRNPRRWMNREVHALEAKNVHKLQITGFKGEAAHPERDLAILMD